MISNVKGFFEKFSITADTDGDDFGTANVSITIDAASISTNNEQRDTHLRSVDFFEVEKYPELAFVSTRIERNGESAFTMYGNLTMKDATNEVKLSVEYGGTLKDPWGNEKAGFTITGKINRKDWGLVWNGVLEAGGVLVGDDVNLMCELELAKAV